jgi:O-antigen ligase
LLSKRAATVCNDRPGKAKVSTLLSFPRFVTTARIFGQIDAMRVARFVAFVAILLLLWISLRPFPDLSDPDAADLENGKLASTYIALGILSVIVLALTMQRHAQALRTLMTPAVILLCCWIGINLVFSHNFGISFQRLVLTGSVLALAACLLLLPASQDEFDSWLSATVLIFLVVCYLGVTLAPSLSIHTERDVFEARLAGDWRGPFGHKNIAAPIMALLVFVGIYLINRNAGLRGAAVISLSSLFLVMTGGKSAMALCLVTFLLSFLVIAIKSVVVRACLVFLPLLSFNLLTVGSVFDERIAAIVNLLPLDTTFTGRTDIWEFALSSLARNPWRGYGFAAFWGTDAILDLVPDDQIEWAASAAHSHNGYLDNALTLGIPGLLLIIAVFVVAPLLNFSAVTQSGTEDPLAKLFLRIWLFGIYLSSMESFLLDRADPIWFTFLIGVFGLHYIARFRLKPELANDRAQFS